MVHDFTATAGLPPAGGNAVGPSSRAVAGSRAWTSARLGEIAELVDTVGLARAKSVMWVSAGAVTLVVAALPHAGAFHAGAVAVLGCLALCAAPVFFAVGNRIPLWLQHVNSVLATLLISVAAYQAGPFSLGLAVFYLSVSIYGFIYYPLRQAAAHVVLVALAYGVVVATAPGQTDAWSRWVVVSASTAVSGVLVGWLMGQVRRLAKEAQALRQEVQQLRIVIDDVRTARQVAEITDSDYFRELERRAGELRSPRP
jgi:hypothetical protein